MPRLRPHPAFILLTVAACASDAKRASSTAPSPSSSVAVTPAVPTAEPPAAPPTGPDLEAVGAIMSMKVVFAAPLLQAIATRDYATVERNATELRALSTQGAFIVHDTVTYRAMSQTFRDDVTRLAAHARERNQSAMEADYQRMAATCFNCHTHIREERETGSLPGRVAMR